MRLPPLRLRERVGSRGEASSARRPLICRLRRHLLPARGRREGAAGDGAKAMGLNQATSDAGKTRAHRCDRRGARRRARRHGRLPPDLGLRPFRPGRADGAVRAGDAGAVACRRQRLSRAGRRLAGARASAWAAPRRVSQTPGADRRRGGAGDGGELCDRRQRADPVRHPALHRRRQPDRRAVRRRAALGGVDRRRSRRRRAVRRCQRGVQPAGAGLARARNRGAQHARLAAAAAVGGRRR